ncbi:MAG: DNA polymerase III subunit beta [Nitrospinae bacterium]|nr:DNA polymerase III subunit beta [Nitrospinota bacterium]
MEFTIGRDEFYKSLQRAQGFVSPKGPMPILANVFLEASDSAITLFASNLDIGLKGSYDAKVSKPGKVTVQAKKLHDIVRTLPPEEILVKVDEDERLRVICGKSKFNLATIDPDQFPSFPEYDEKTLIGLDSEMVREMISKTSYAISHDETRLTLNGAFLEVAPSRARMVATDGHRLAFVERDGAFKVSEPVKVIIARKAVGELQKLVSEDDEPLQFVQRENHVIFKKGRQTMVVRLIEGAFPNYEQVIPKGSARQATITTASFTDCLKRVATMADEKSHMIRMGFGEGKVEMSSEGGELGEARDEVEAEFAGESVEIGLNAEYIIEMLGAMGADKVALKMQDALSPLMAVVPEDSGLISIVMPMRL